MIEDPVEILVKMAEQGEIDPWNIDITEVTDRFFEEMEKQQVLDLRLSARTLLYAATLLRIKSDYLLESVWDGDCEDDSSDNGSEEETGNQLLSPSFQNPVQFLESEIKRRLERKNMRKQPITLYDLINLLRNAEKEDRRRQRDSWVHDGLVYTEDIVSIAHDESYQENADAVLASLRESATGGEGTTLSEMAKRLEWPRAHVFIPLLFLMQEGHLSLWQESFFGEIYIEPSGRSDSPGQDQGIFTH